MGNLSRGHKNPSYVANKSLKYRKQNLLELKGEMAKPTVIVGNLNTPS